MQIIKEVKIKIESVIDNLDPSGLVEGESERNITEHTGSYSFSEERTTLTYSETGEGGKVDSEIIYENGSVRVKRFGAIESDLIFKEGEFRKGQKLALCRHGRIFPLQSPGLGRDLSVLFR